MANESKKDSRIKQGKKGIVLAKDAKQLRLAIALVALFILNSIFLLVKNFMENNQANINANQANIEAAKNPLDKNNVTVPVEDPSAPPLDATNNNMNPTGTQNATPQQTAQDANNIYNQTLGLQKNGTNVGSRKVRIEDNVEILPKNKTTQKTPLKTVLISVSNSGRPNPFQPEAEVAHLNSNLPMLTVPPETLPSDTDATKIINTTISGILYDRYSPSAIINIAGTDYLVKRGDIINHYKVLGINQSQVIVQLGKNVYKAGVGELLTLSNNTTTANLSRKFGGNYVSINVKRKKGY